MDKTSMAWARRKNGRREDLRNGNTMRAKRNQTQLRTIAKLSSEDDQLVVEIRV